MYICTCIQVCMGFCGASSQGLHSGKESTCNAGNASSIPGSGRSPGEGNGNPLQYSCLENPTDRGEPWGCKESDTTEQLSLTHSLLLKNLPEMQKTPVQFLGREDPLEKGMASHSSILAWRIPWTEEWATVHGVTKSQTQLSD